jgi:hypothetical protein
MIEQLPRFMAEPLFSVINNWDWLHKKVNAISINQQCNVCPQRPHPWSTVHDYTSDGADRSKLERPAIGGRKTFESPGA